MGKKITVSVIKADVGSFVGHANTHPEVMEKAAGMIIGSPLLIDSYVTHVGDDLNLIMTHELGKNNGEIHQLAWDTFVACTEVAKKLKLYGAGQDLLADAFSGNIKGLGPGVAEMEFEERKSEPIIVFMADKTEPGAWNLPLYKIFADPFNTAGLVIDPSMHDGFLFEVQDLSVNQSTPTRFDGPPRVKDISCQPQSKICFGKRLFSEYCRYPRSCRPCSNSNSRQNSTCAGGRMRITKETE